MDAQFPKFKLFDDVIADGTATGKGNLTGMIWEEKPKVISGKYYYVVHCIGENFLVAEHHLKKLNK